MKRSAHTRAVEWPTRIALPTAETNVPNYDLDYCRLMPTDHSEDHIGSVPAGSRSRHGF